MFEYTMNNGDDSPPDDYAPVVCLPLLIATIGALHSKQERIAADLYECSRRCIHVYLDSRKTDEGERSTTHNSPLWLVQSLVLSVMYGLFAEYDDSDLSVILRQVSALCTLIKVSKFNLISFGHENIEINQEYFEEYILYQSKVTVFMIFNISIH
ncbi:Transcriptional regulator ADR1 [Cyberlindnera fabianii]|uniref:Transcriptional regulator ADR1 n=1 Tax=Cyberlindnera fabianii TaxID=36022 RepID=A0A1V2L1R0_CYBFA|nr:Transcriptional regulator ADR1 [Cyberlindnera fabianii]